MTPKEKAKELVDKMKAQQMPSLRVSTMEINLNDTMPNAKQCALIAVEQIETITNHYPPNYMLTVYWQEVKKEIERL